MEKMITLTIDGVEVTVPEGTTVLNAARKANVKIPTLCYLKDINVIGACRMCLVDVGARDLAAACVMPASEGMKVKTNTPVIREARKVNLELILSDHEKKCLTCVRSQNCELQRLTKELGVEGVRFEGKTHHFDLDLSSPSIVRDNNKCILCRRCVAACTNVQTVGVLGASERGFNTKVAPVFNKKLGEVPCVNCGQCIQACPVGALREVDDTEKVWMAINDAAKHVVVHTAPSIRVGLGEEFGMPLAARVTGKMATALKRMGFDKVFDTNFAADVTIMEESNELLERLTKGGKLPMITSCSPGWIKFCEHNFPDFLDNLSTCKSPMSMEGALIKSYYAEKAGIDPKDIVVVSVMPCTAKKYESTRPEMGQNGLRDTDIVITTRELASMIKEANMDFASLPDGQFDELMSEGSGAGAIFGATGGVMEAALRTTYETVTGKTLPKVDFDSVRGVDGIKEASVEVGDVTVNVAVAHGLGNARKLLDAVRSGEKNYHFIEIMACPGGCITGGGQPIVSAQDKMDVDPRVLRAKAIYEEDAALPIRKSHENPDVKKVYEEYLGKPGGHKSHELLHTHYIKRENYTAE